MRNIFKIKEINKDYHTGGSLIFSVVFDSSFHPSDLNLSSIYSDVVPPDKQESFRNETIAFLKEHGSFQVVTDSSPLKFGGQFTASTMDVGHLMAQPKEFCNRQYACVGKNFVQLVRYSWSSDSAVFDDSLELQALEKLLDKGENLQFWLLEWEHPYWDYPNLAFAFGWNLSSLEEFLDSICNEG